jgi:tetratricopeptide (TPR) repeat protein
VDTVSHSYAKRCILTGISQTYEGHPLVLQVITGEILQVYQGDVTAYWKVNRVEFEQVSRELKSSRLTETGYNEQLARRVRERVKKSLEQLPEKAIALLCRSSVYRRPVPQSFWLGLITEYSIKEQIEAYRILGDRTLIETERNLIRLHNLVRDIAYDWLRDDEIIWNATEVKAAELWLNDYQPEENAENLEKVRGYLEAFYHYCNIEDWRTAKQILQAELEIINNQELTGILFIWGYYRELEVFYNLLLNRLELDFDLICYQTLASVNATIGNHKIAIDLCKKGLYFSHKIDNYYYQLSFCMRFYMTLGSIYIESDDNKEAIRNSHKALKINKTLQNNIDNMKIRINIYNNLGNAYFGTGSV